MLLEQKEKKAAIISRQGLGDGLIMMILSHALVKKGYHVVFYHRLFHELKSFFPSCDFRSIPPLDEIAQFDIYDLVIIEDYKHETIKELIRNRDEKSYKLHVIYPSFKEKKQGSLHRNDFVCNKKKSMNYNISWISSKILKDHFPSRYNGIIFPTHLTHRKHNKQIILHPTSTDKNKNWKSSKFIRLYQELKKSGYSPVLSIAPHESSEWKKSGLEIVTFSNFHDLACYIFESGYLIGNDSGPAHLASNLNIPTIVLASNRKMMNLWKPDFYMSKVITPSSLIFNPKFFRFRNKYWSLFISIKKVLKEFNKIRNT